MTPALAKLKALHEAATRDRTEDFSKSRSTTLLCLYLEDCELIWAVKPILPSMIALWEACNAYICHGEDESYIIQALEALTQKAALVLNDDAGIGGVK